MSKVVDTALDVMREEIRNEVLAEAARKLLEFCDQRFAEYGPHDQRGATLWDAAWYLVQQMGDGNLRTREDA